MKKKWHKLWNRHIAFLLVICCLSWIGIDPGFSGSAQSGMEGFLETLELEEPSFMQNGSLILEKTEGVLPAENKETDGLRQAAELPSAYSLLNDGGTCYVTSVKDQGDTGLCWAYAALGACESNVLKQGLTFPEEWKDENGELNFSEAALGWYPYTPHNLPGDYCSGDNILLENKGAGGGNASIAGYSLAAGNGTQLEKYAPFSDWENGYSEYQRYVSYYRMRSTDIISEIGETERSVLKQWLMESGAVSISFYSQETYYDNGTTVSYYQNQKGAEFADHAVLLVGWDDAYSKENFRPDMQPERDGAWLVRNSWGADDVDHGYFWISYEELSLCEAARFLMEENNPNATCYQYDGSVSYSSLRQSAVSNVFTVEEDCMVSDIMFPLATYNPDAAYYTVRLYLLDENATSPSDGTQLAEQSGWIYYEGYKSIAVDENILLKKGDVVSVVLELRENSKQYSSPLYAAFESEVYDDATGMQRECSVQAGQTYVRNSYGEWADIMDLKMLQAEDGSYPFGNLGNAAIKLVVQNTAADVNTTQLYAAIRIAQEYSGDSLCSDAYMAAMEAQLSSDATQQEVDRAACNLLGALEQAGISTYPQYVYVGKVNDSTLGDVDQNGTVDTMDAYWTLYTYACISAGEYADLTMKQAAAADMVQNGTIDTEDAYHILLLYTKISSGQSE